MIDSNATVFIIDDDPGVRAGLESLLRSMNYRVVSFATGRAFLEASPPSGPCCVVLDVRLPSQSGLELQAHLKARGRTPPIVFISGHADVRSSVRAMKAGAVDFLEKPFHDQELLDAVQTAIERDRAQISWERRLAELRGRFDVLTARERDVFPLVVAGLPNKSIAAELSVSEITVKIHRSNLMKKMGARTLADLVRMGEALKTTGG